MTRTRWIVIAAALVAACGGGKPAQAPEAAGVEHDAREPVGHERAEKAEPSGGGRDHSAHEH
jgi:hypothetical protein